MDDLTERFGALVSSSLGLRFAHAFHHFKIPFPPFSPDPVEHWLVCEALMARYEKEAEATQAHEQAFAAAQASSQELLEAHLRERDGG